VPISPPIAPAPPRLAETGSSATIPLLGIGSLLLLAGMGLSLAGRRQGPSHA
jgi:LPXTG-motif cell wall-anchored protein